MKSPYIFYRRRRTPLKIPEGWNLLTFADFEEEPAEADPVAMTKKALDEPIGCPALRESLSPSDTVAILIEDITRASPKRLILGSLIEELRRYGIPEDRISVVISLGTHRALSKEEMENAFGGELLEKYPFTSHDCHARDLVPVGTLDTGREVKIHPKVHEASFKIGIGSIFPHPMNGFGGGAKILFPGVADFDSILEHHLKYAFHVRAGLGRLEGNPFYEQVCAVGRKAGLRYVINSVLDHRDQLYDVVSGNPIEAHLAGIEKSKGIISKRFSGKSDLTIITSFPYSEGPQIMKPLAPASMVTKEGGVIIMFADSTGNLPEPFIAGFEAFHGEHGDNLLKGVQDRFSENRLIMEGSAIDFNMAAGMALIAQHTFKIIIVSEDIPRDKVERMGFLYGSDEEEAFELGKKLAPRPDVHIIPSGGIILPVL
jgi:nickel-dependent lactate racemase